MSVQLCDVHAILLCKVLHKLLIPKIAQPGMMQHITYCLRTPISRSLVSRGLESLWLPTLLRAHGVVKACAIATSESTMKASPALSICNLLQKMPWQLCCALHTNKLHNERMHVMLTVCEQFCSRRQCRRVLPVSILVDSLSRKHPAQLCYIALLGFPLPLPEQCHSTHSFHCLSQTCRPTRL